MILKARACRKVQVLDMELDEGSEIQIEIEEFRKISGGLWVTPKDAQGNPREWTSFNERNFRPMAVLDGGTVKWGVYPVGGV